MHEDLGLVVDHVDRSVFLSHLKLEDTVERLPSRHLALRAEDVKAQYEALTPETRERLNNVLSRKEVNPYTNVSLAHARCYLKVSRNPLLRVYRDVLVKDETAHESEIDLSVEPHTIDEHDGISSTRKRRRLTHQSPVTARFSDDFKRTMLCRFRQIVLCPPLAEILIRSELLLERLALLVQKAIYILLPWKRGVNLARPSLEDTDTLSISWRREMTPPSCPLCSKPMIRRQNRVYKGSFWGCQQWKCNGTRRPSLILAAAQHLDSSCTDCWNRAVRFGRLDLLEVCANSDSPLLEAVESAGGQCLRTSFWNGYDLTTRRGRARSVVSGTSSQRVSRILDGICATH